MSKRVQGLPPYVFSVIHEKKAHLQAKGIDVIDLGIGAPDLPTPYFIVEKMIAELAKPQNFTYSPYEGCEEFREAIAAFYEKHYSVQLDPKTEILTLIGSKEGIANIFPALIDKGDTVLIPDPGYPVYRTAAYLAGAECLHLPLDAKNQYRPLFSELSIDTCQNAKMMVLNYPSNPTAATVDLAVFQEAISFAKKYRIAVIHDAAYALVTFGDYAAPSIMQVPGAKDIAVEFGSLSKSFNMTGWRIGYVVGNKDMIRALATIKSNIDSSQFLPIQKAAAAAMLSDFTTVVDNNQVYEERLHTMLSALRTIGIEVEEPQGTFFIWARVPPTYTSTQFTEKLLEEAGVVITPGNAFGPSGEGYFRLSLSVPTVRLKEAAARMKNLERRGG